MLFTSFSAGELSPTFFGRIDIEQYYKGVSKLSNFTVLPTGGIKRREGMQRLDTLSGPCRLIPFVINPDFSYILEFGANYIKFWKNGEKLLFGGEQTGFYSTEEISLYASLSEIRDVQYCQNYGTIIFVHRNYPPLSLRWLGGDSFELKKIQFNFIPDYKINDPYGSFTPDPQPIDTETFQTINNYPGCCAFFANRLWLAGTNNYPQKIWASCAPDVSGNRYYSFKPYTKYVTVQKNIKDPDLQTFSADINDTNLFLLVNVTQELLNIIKKNVTDYYISGNNIQAGTKVVEIDDINHTLLINNAAIQACTLNVFTIQLWKQAGIPSADDYENLPDLVNDITSSDHSFSFEVASDKNDAIKWLSSSNYLCVGTESSEWIIPPQVDALNLYAQLNSRYGSHNVQATTVGNAIIYFAPGKKAIREYYYSAGDEAFRSNDLALLAKQMLDESAAVDFDFVNNPYNSLVITRSDGKVVKLLYDKTIGVMAWSRLERSGNQLIRTCCTTPGPAGSDYEYYAVLDNGVYYLERLDADQKVFLDSWKLYSGSTAGYGTDAVLYNTTQKTQCNAHEIPAGFISGGDIVYIGYIFTSSFTSMPCVLDKPQVRISRLKMRLLDSTLPQIKAASLTEQITGKDEPYTGIIEIPFPGTFNPDSFFEVLISKPESLTVLSIEADLA